MFLHEGILKLEGFYQSRKVQLPVSGFQKRGDLIVLSVDCFQRGL